MSMLVGLLAKQIMRHAELSETAGMEKYHALFVSTDQYSGIKPDVDALLRKCGYDRIVASGSATARAESNRK